jgi:hypothetical protein
MALPTFDFAFEPDVYAEEELSEIPEAQYIDKSLITDINIKKCRLIVSLCSIEYGTASSSAAAFLVFRFVFQPFDARFNSAIFTLNFENNATVYALAPEYIEGNKSETVIRNKLNGQLTIGYSVVSASVGAERETEQTKPSKMHIQGSGVDTDLVRWTMEENKQQKSGLPDTFTGAIVVKSQGEIKATLNIHATIGKDWAFRKIVCSEERLLVLDGTTKLGTRPEGLQIAENCFIST